MEETSPYKGRLRQRAQRKSYSFKDTDYEETEEDAPARELSDSGSGDDFRAGVGDGQVSDEDEELGRDADAPASSDENPDDGFSNDGNLDLEVDGDGDCGQASEKKQHGKKTPQRSKRPFSTIQNHIKRSKFGTEYDSGDVNNNRLTVIYGTNPDILEAAIRMVDIYRMDVSAPRHSHLTHSLFFKAWVEEKEAAKAKFEINKNQIACFVDLNDPKYELYFPGRKTDSVSLQLGPIRDGKQKLFKLSRFSFMSLSTPTVFPEKRGFVLNVGASVTAIEWATKKANGNQYLAVGAVPKDFERPAIKVPPGFCPFPRPATLQIWQFSANELPPALEKVSLHLALVFDWGGVVDMQWQPGILGDTQDVGLLLCVFEDGRARVISVPCRRPMQSPIVKLEKPVFEMRLKDTMATVCTWIGHHKVLLGCANGMAALYDLNTLNLDNVAIPIMYYPLNDSFITRIVHLAPSMPHHVASVGVDGHFTLHDLRDPQSTKMIMSQSYHRAIDSAGLAWHDRSYSLIFTDGTKFNSIYPVRRLGKRMRIIEGNTEAIAVSMGGGGSHPFILSGSSDGKVFVVNPYLKIATLKTDASRQKLFQQIWFIIEYSRKLGIYRMRDEFPLEPKSTFNEISENFYIPETYIKKVCWNPNKAYGTWAAAGIGGGLVRVEDIALDVLESVTASDEVRQADEFREKLRQGDEKCQEQALEEDQPLIDEDNSKEPATVPATSIPQREHRATALHEQMESESKPMNTNHAQRQKTSSEESILQVQAQIIKEIRQLHEVMHPNNYGSNISTRAGIQQQKSQQPVAEEGQSAPPRRLLARQASEAVVCDSGHGNSLGFQRQSATGVQQRPTSQDRAVFSCGFQPMGQWRMKPPSGSGLLPNAAREVQSSEKERLTPLQENEPLSPSLNDPRPQQNHQQERPREGKPRNVLPSTRNGHFRHLSPGHSTSLRNEVSRQVSKTTETPAFSWADDVEEAIQSNELPSFVNNQGEVANYRGKGRESDPTTFPSLEKSSQTWADQVEEAIENHELPAIGNEGNYAPRPNRKGLPRAPVSRANRR